MVSRYINLTQYSYSRSTQNSWNSRHTRLADAIHSTDKEKDSISNCLTL